MDKAAAWCGGMAFMGGVVVICPPDAHDFGTAALLFVASLVMAVHVSPAPPRKDIARDR